MRQSDGWQPKRHQTGNNGIRGVRGFFGRSGVFRRTQRSGTEPLTKSLARDTPSTAKTLEKAKTCRAQSFSMKQQVRNRAENQFLFHLIRGANIRNIDIYRL